MNLTTRAIALIILSITIINCSTTLAAIHNPANGHYYDRIDGNLTWDEANSAAQSLTFNGLQGHLATIQNAQENQFISDNLVSGASFGVYFLGGFQSPGTPEPNGEWQWVTGEAWSYTNWTVQNPNDDTSISPQGQDAVAMYSSGWSSLSPIGQWDDYWKDYSDNHAAGYIVEYEAVVPEPTTFMVWSLLGLSAVGISRKLSR